jgi:hypothetical protein
MFEIAQMRSGRRRRMPLEAYEETSMTVIEPGQRYLLNAGTPLHFVRKTGASSGDGTTNEELLEVLIHRLTEAYQAVPCVETVRALYLLHETLLAFRLRADKRASAGVTGTSLPHDSEADRERFARLKSAMQLGRALPGAPDRGRAEQPRVKQRRSVLQRTDGGIRA